MEPGADDPFNPSLVRLAQVTIALKHMIQAAFNPSLVRLAPWHPRDIYLASSHFQSQLGSIGASFSCHL